MRFSLDGYTPGSALAGGALIGLAAVALLLLTGRLAGISGLFANLLGGGGAETSEGRPVQAGFLAGLLAGGALLLFLLPSAFEPLGTASSTLARFGVAGLIVGFGSRLGGGCTSGHGGCGISLRSPRSLAATLTFLATAMGVVAVRLHFLAGFGGVR